MMKEMMTGFLMRELEVQREWKLKGHGIELKLPLPARPRIVSTNTVGYTLLANKTKIKKNCSCSYHEIK